MEPYPAIPVFDIGEVLIDWSPLHLTDKMGLSRSDARDLLTEIGFDAWNLALDGGGRWSTAVDQLCAEFPQHSEFIQVLDDRWTDMIAGPVLGSVALLDRLLQRHDAVYAITNFSSEKWRVAQSLYPFLTHFNGVIVSGDEHLLKPDPAIYWCLADRYDLDPKDCLFIDDRVENVVGARSIGMQAVQFTSPQKLEQDLVTHRLL